MALFFTNKLVLQRFESLKTACKLIAATEMFLPVMIVFHLVLENHGFCLCNPRIMVKADNSLFGYEFGFDISFALSMLLIICCAVKFYMGLKLYLGVSQEDDKFCYFWFLINILTFASGAVFLICKIPYYKDNLILAGADLSLFVYQLWSLWLIHQFLIALRLRNDDKGKQDNNNKEKVGNNENISSSSKKIEVYVV